MSDSDEPEILNIITAKPESNTKNSVANRGLITSRLVRQISPGASKLSSNVHKTEINKQKQKKRPSAKRVYIPSQTPLTHRDDISDILEARFARILTSANETSTQFKKPHLPNSIEKPTTSRSSNLNVSLERTNNRPESHPHLILSKFRSRSTIDWASVDAVFDSQLSSLERFANQYKCLLYTPPAYLPFDTRIDALIDGGTVSAHRFLLLAQCPTFTVDLVECINSNDGLRFQLALPLDSTAVRALLHYVYTGSMPLINDGSYQVQSIADVARKYHLSQLLAKINHITPWDNKTAPTETQNTEFQLSPTDLSSPVLAIHMSDLNQENNKQTKQDSIPLRDMTQIDVTNNDFNLLCHDNSLVTNNHLQEIIPLAMHNHTPAPNFSEQIEQQIQDHSLASPDIFDSFIDFQASTSKSTMSLETPPKSATQIHCTPTQECISKRCVSPAETALRTISDSTLLLENTQTEFYTDLQNPYMTEDTSYTETSTGQQLMPIEVNKENDGSDVGSCVYNGATMQYRVIKTQNPTPIPDFDTLNTPAIKNELARYGCRPLKNKAKARGLLREIYEHTHPIIDEHRETPALKRAPSAPTTPMDANQAHLRILHVKNKRRRQSELANVDVKESPTKKPKRLNDSREVTTYLINWFKCQDDFFRQILMFEPINFEEAYARINNIGFDADRPNERSTARTVSKKSLIDFLDEQGVSFQLNEETNHWKMQRQRIANCQINTNNHTG